MKELDIPKRMLVVDDDPAAVKIIRSHLMMYDFEVEDIGDPTKVIDHLHETNDYGLYIIDVNMPGKDGITLATQIRKSFRSTTPILFVSGDINETTANRIRRLKTTGHVEFLRKGEFDSKELFNLCMGMLKDHANTMTMRELKGRLSHLQENFGEGMTKIASFMSDIQASSVVTQAACDKKAEAIMKAVRKEVIGITIAESKKKIDEELRSEPLAIRIGGALKTEHIEAKLTPEVALKKVRAAATWKVTQYFLLIIFGGLSIFWATMWNKAEHADAGVQALNIKHKQTIDSVQAQTAEFRKIQRILSNPPSRIPTHP